MTSHPRKASVRARPGTVKNLFSLQARLGTLLAGLMLSSLALIASASAATITVGNTGDPAVGDAAKCNVASTCTLRDAIAKAANVTGATAGDTIVFGLPVNSTITLSGSELLVEKNLSINGEAGSGLAISGNHQSSVFKINSGVVATLKQLLIKNGYVNYPARGGGIDNSGILTLIDSTVSGNTAAYGGGVSNDNGMLKLIDSAISSNSGSFQGGGIWSIGGTLTLVRSAVLNNKADGGGGGGIYNMYTTMTLTDSEISSNTGNRSDGGGGIYNYRGQLTLTNSKVSDNTAISTTSESGGGGIRNDSGILTLTDCTISNNVATSLFSSGGGGIYSNGTLKLTHSMVTGNIANGGFGPGGGIANHGATSLIDTEISGNTAADFGGGIRNGGDLTMADSTISDNTAIDGGGIHNVSRTLILTNSTISRNTASKSGGGIHNTYNGVIEITDSVVSDNTASYGGGVYSYFPNTVTNITGSLVANNAAIGNADSSGGGIVNAFGSIVVLNESTVSDNTATFRGGGIDNANGTSISHLAVIKTSVIGNRTHGNGGGAYNSSFIALADSIISNNSAAERGGGIDNSGELRLANSTISSNTANIAGSGVYNEGASTLVHGTLAGNVNTAVGMNDDIFRLPYSSTSAGNTIIENCLAGGAGAKPLTDNGGNLDGGNGCGFTNSSSKSNATLDLGTLADNGGPTPTMMPGTNSDAIGFGLSEACRNAPVNGRDQRGYVRPAIGCTSGAVDPNGAANDSIFFDGFGFGGQ